MANQDEKTDGQLQTEHHNADRSGDTAKKEQAARELRERGWTGTKVEPSQPTTWTWRRRKE